MVPFESKVYGPIPAGAFEVTVTTYELSIDWLLKSTTISPVSLKL